MICHLCLKLSRYKCYFFFSKRRIISGMVIAPLSWCRGEWVDYTFAANLAPCVLNILQKKYPPRPPIVDRIYHENTDGSFMNVIFYYYLLHLHMQSLLIIFFSYSIR